MKASTKKCAEEERCNETYIVAHCIYSKLRNLAAAGACSRLERKRLIGIACAGMRSILLPNEIKVE